MGQSTDAIIAFGFNLGEELTDSLQTILDENGNEIDEALAEDHGISLPEYSASIDWKDYAAAREEALSNIKIDLIPHCSGEYPMYFLAARGSSKRARRGYPEALEPCDTDTYKYRSQSLDAMREFCERHGIEYKDPKWHIFSMWN